MDRLIQCYFVQPPTTIHNKRLDLEDKLKIMISYNMVPVTCSSRHEPNKSRVNSVVPEEYTVLAAQVATVVLLLYDMNFI